MDNPPTDSDRLDAILRELQTTNRLLGETLTQLIEEKRRRFGLRNG